jgi:hypothetical protein
MSKTVKRIQTSMRFKPETLKILDRYQSERAIPRTYLIETIIDQWHAQQMAQPKKMDRRTGSVYVDPRETKKDREVDALLDGLLGDDKTDPMSVLTTRVKNLESAIALMLASKNG